MPGPGKKGGRNWLDEWERDKDDKLEKAGLVKVLEPPKMEQTPPPPRAKTARHYDLARDLRRRRKFHHASALRAMDERGDFLLPEDERPPKV